MAPHRQHRFRPTTAGILIRFRTLVREPIFLITTVIVHGAVALAAIGFWVVEQGANPMCRSWLDALYWAVTTMMTVGYGDIVPMTDAGKMIAIGLMAVGTVANVAYTALFVGVLIMPELRMVERRMEDQVHDEELKLERLAARLAAAAEAFQRHAAKDTNAAPRHVQRGGDPD